MAHNGANPNQQQRQLAQVSTSRRPASPGCITDRNSTEVKGGKIVTKWTVKNPSKKGPKTTFDGQETL
jgi:hypothetical protein